MKTIGAVRLCVRILSAKDEPDCRELILSARPTGRPGLALPFEARCICVICGLDESAR